MKKILENLKKEFQTVDYQELKINASENDISKLDNKSSYIYVITAVGKSCNLKEKIENKFKKLEKAPKINDPAFVNKQNGKKIYLYVGSSKGIRTRLKQHFGYTKTKKTYALHLELLEDLFCNITIQLYKFHCKYEFVKCIEVNLHEKYNPLFGQNSLR